MAATKRNAMLIEEARLKIRTTQLVNRLTNHALGQKKVKMDNSQVAAALGLLKKSLPDLATTTIQGPSGGPVIIATGVHRDDKD